MRVLVTGSQGFIGKNLTVRLGEIPDFDVVRFDREDDADTLPTKLDQIDVVVHLAGENRPKDFSDFSKGNAELTETLCSAIAAKGKKIHLILASSRHAAMDKGQGVNELTGLYGESKRAAEVAVEKLVSETANSAIIYRMPGVFGKWCKPNYNSVVATFCHNIATDLTIQINNPTALIELVYIDDVVTEFISALTNMDEGIHWEEITPEYTITLGELAQQIKAFKNSRLNLISERVGTGWKRALYSTYLSYLLPEAFVYELPCHRDPRGLFVEMLKTPDCGQFSYIMMPSGETRGQHYHHTKTEKFLVATGTAHFSFRNIITEEKYEIIVHANEIKIVESIPGWTHNITNIGDDEMIVLLWSNEIFDPDEPDTVSCRV